MKQSNDVLRHWPTFVATLSAALGSCTIGAVIGYTSPAVPDINLHPNSFHLNAIDISILASIICPGAIVGMIFGGYLSDRFGRKRVIMFSSVPTVVGWVLIGCAPNVICMYVGRVLTGISCGIADCVVPVYISEISDKTVRGFMCSCHELFLNLGMLLVFVFGIFLHWNWLVIVCAIPPVLMLICLLFVPESPRWLLANAGKANATEALLWLRRSTGSDEVAAELREMEENIATSFESSIRWKEIGNPTVIKPIGIIVGLMFFQQTSGYGVFPEFLVSIFQAAKSTWNPYVQTAVVGVSGVIANAISCLAVDRAGRRFMLILSGTLMAVSLAGLASFFTAKHYVSDQIIKDYLIWLPIVSLILYNFAVSLGYGPIPFFLSSELLPLRARSMGSAISVSSVWVFLFVTTYSFEQLRALIDEYYLYWMFCGFTILGILFVFAIVPETKGKSLEEMEFAFVKKREIMICEDTCQTSNL